MEDLSFGRIFHYEDIKSLEEGVVREFFINAFDSGGMKCDDDALDFACFVLSRFSINDVAYW